MPDEPTAVASEQVLVSIDSDLIPALVAVLSQNTQHAVVDGPPKLKVSGARLYGLGAVVYIERDQ